MRAMIRVGSLWMVMLLLAACGPLGQPATPTSAKDSIAPTPAEGGIAPTPTAAVGPGGRQVVIDAPATGEAVSCPVPVSGRFSIAPFESTFTGRVYDAAGQVIGEGPVMTTASMGQPGSFSGSIPCAIAAGGPGRVEIAELSAKDGSLVVGASVDVQLAAPSQPTQLPAQPTELPAGPTATTAPARELVIETPANGATVSSPVTVSGWFSVAPFESTFRGRVYDASGQVVGEGPVMAAVPMGQPGTFSGSIPFSVRAGGAGQVEIAEISPRDGSVIASASAEVQLAATAPTGAIEIPGPNATVTLPVHVLVRAGTPGEQAAIRLRWQDGTELMQTFPVLPGEDGRGLVIGNVDWNTEGMPPQPPTQPATLRVEDGAGRVLAEQSITVLSHDDPNVQQVMVYFVLGETLQGIQRAVPRTEAIGTAALTELLWGPAPPNLAGFETAIPTPEEVLKFQGRGSDWGPRVTLRKLTIVDGVATADFSKEMNAYAGGSLRVKLIRDQITQTLLQFATVQQVIIAVEGQTEDVLQP